MARDFPANVKDKALERSGHRCEWPGCGGMLKGKAFHYDHIKSHAMGGESTLENCQVLCTPHHLQKTMDDDMPQIRAADRKGKVKQGLIVAAGVSEIARRFGIK